MQVCARADALCSRDASHRELACRGTQFTLLALLVQKAQLLTPEVLTLLALLVQKSTNTDTLVAERDLECENTAGNRAGALGYSLYLLY
jgi:hypothetical protein